MVNDPHDPPHRGATIPASKSGFVRFPWMYEIATDVRTGLIEVKVQGFWTLDQVSAFIDAMTVAAKQVQATGKSLTILYDYTGAAIQSQDVVAALKQFAAEDRFKSRRVAIYTEGMLATMQAKRIATTDDRIATFDNRNDALAWLVLP